ncbi:MAG: hypothetical protein IPG50_23365 [Myxococcales bacterium]|nr:hypothetical protein [Myxococcales bacterium]
MNPRPGRAPYRVRPPEPPLRSGFVRAACVVVATPEERVALYNDIQCRGAALMVDARLDVGDCYVVATLNGIAAAPGGLARLGALVSNFDEGLAEVALLEPDGSRVAVILPLLDPPRKSQEGSGAQGHPTLRIVERAIRVANGDATEPYAGVPIAGLPRAVMAQLGLADAALAPSDALGFAWKVGDFVSACEGATRALAAYGLHPARSYVVAGALEEATTGEAMLVLHDASSESQPSPIPASVSDVFFVRRSRRKFEPSAPTDRWPRKAG